jgi:hypothetical protein
MQKPLVQRLQQLKQCAKLLEQSKKVLKNLDQLQLTFIDLARQVHHIQLEVAVDYDIDRHLNLTGTHTSGLGKESSSVFVVQIPTSIFFLTLLVT